MPQVSYSYTTTGKTGGLYGRDNYTRTYTNPISAQVSTATVGGTTNGLYTLQVTDDETDEVWSWSFTASSSTAAQIATGIVTAIGLDTTFIGIGTAIDSTADVVITFDDKDHSYTVAWTADASGASTVALTTAPGGSVLIPGIFVYESSEGYVSPAVAAGAAALVGIVVDGPDAETTNGETTPVYGYPPGAQVTVLTQGECWVKVGDAVAASGAVDFRGASGTTDIPLGTPGSSSLTNGTAVPNGAARFTSSGTALGLARIQVNLP